MWEVTFPPHSAQQPSSLPISPQRGETALDFAKYNTNKGESIPLLDKVRLCRPVPGRVELALCPIPIPIPSHSPSPAPAPSPTTPAPAQPQPRAA